MTANTRSAQPVDEDDTPEHAIAAPDHVFIDLDTGDWFPQRCGERPDGLVECRPVPSPGLIREKARQVALKIQIWLREDGEFGDDVIGELADIIAREFGK